MRLITRMNIVPFGYNMRSPRLSQTAFIRPVFNRGIKRILKMNSRLLMYTKSNITAQRLMNASSTSLNINNTFLYVSLCIDVRDFDLPVVTKNNDKLSLLTEFILWNTGVVRTLDNTLNDESS